MDQYRMPRPGEARMRPEWVRVAVRYPDGQVLTYEFTELLRDVTLEAEREHVDLHEFSRFEPVRRMLRDSLISLNVVGRMMTARHFTEWGTQPPASPAGELPSAPQRALERAEPGE